MEVRSQIRVAGKVLINGKNKSYMKDAMHYLPSLDVCSPFANVGETKARKQNLSGAHEMAEN